MMMMVYVAQAIFSENIIAKVSVECGGKEVVNESTGLGVTVVHIGCVIKLGAVFVERSSVKTKLWCWSRVLTN